MDIIHVVGPGARMKAPQDAARLIDPSSGIGETRRREFQGRQRKNSQNFHEECRAKKVMTPQGRTWLHANTPTPTRRLPIGRFI